MNILFRRMYKKNLCMIVQRFFNNLILWVFSFSGINRRLFLEPGFHWDQYFSKALNSKEIEVDWYRIYWFFLDWEMVIFNGFGFLINVCWTSINFWNKDTKPGWLYKSDSAQFFSYCIYGFMSRFTKNK